MTLNEIKKALYKEQSIAYFDYFRKGHLYYSTFIGPADKEVRFAIPASDTGDADFNREMPAKHLIRYIQN